MNKPSSSQSSYTPEVRRNRGISPLWLLPILTMALAGWLLVKAINEAGQRIQIYFSDAQGLVAGRTTIRYQGLEVGMVRDIKLAEGLDSIYVDADIYPEATKLLGNDTRFWLVKPSASLSGISGLDALVSGNYIAIYPASAVTENIPTTFTAIDTAPVDLLANQGLNITLRARDLGGISVGSQIVYRKIPIGEVYSYELDPDAKYVLIHAYIKDEFHEIINDRSRFWNVSGIGAQIGFQGVDVRLESLSALIGGSIAVDSPEGGEPIAENTLFRLYPDLKTAGRGIPVKISLPDNSNISASGAPIIYRGIEVGQITDLNLSEDHSEIIASAAIQPSFGEMLTTGSQFVLEEAQLSLTGVENLKNLVQGNFLSLVPGEGDRARQFTAIRKNDFNRRDNRSVPLKLVASDSFGLDEGSLILYRGIKVGSVTEVRLDQEQVIFDVLVNQQYAHLIKSANRFYVTGTTNVELTEDGLNVSIPPAKQLLTGSISFVSKGRDKPQPQYQLYASKNLAELAQHNLSGAKTLTLYATQLPPVSKGSPLLYRNLAVGSVADFRLVDGGVLIDVRVDNQYKYLVTDQTVFWNYSGIEVNAGLQGVKVTAAPLKSMLQGGIAFDSLPGVDNKLKDKWKLFENFDQARKFGRVVTLIADGESTVSMGTEIKYNGITVGEVTLQVPHFERNQIEIKAHLLPEYADKISRQGSYFWVEQARIGLNGIENLDNLITKTIQVIPGSGKTSEKFKLRFKPQDRPGIEFTLQSATRGSVSAGTPILFREMEVGYVTNVTLGEFADRIISTIRIYPQYAYLVRQSSVFWNTSGVDVTVGITGASVNAGTLDSIVRGGITFATPPDSTLAPQAKQGQTFLLYPRADETWKGWRTPIPAPR